MAGAAADVRPALLASRGVLPLDPMPFATLGALPMAEGQDKNHPHPNPSP